MHDPNAGTTPERVDLFPSGEIGIVWKDAHESVYSSRYLRQQCPCAACVDEMTGKRILDPSSVPDDIVPRIVQGVGNYGVQFVWSDGHSTGIYSHRALRGLCPCGSCRADADSNSAVAAP